MSNHDDDNRQNTDRHVHAEVSGNGNTVGDIVGGDKVEGDKVGGDKIVYPPRGSNDEPPKTIIWRERLEPATIAGHPLRTWYFVAAGAIGLFAGLAEIASFLAPTDDSAGAAWLQFLTMSGGAGIGLFGAVLHGASYIKLPGLMLEKDNRNRIYRTGITGTCGLCQNRHSTVRLSGFGPGGNNQPTMIICNRNPQQHRLVFDPTVLPEIEDDLKQIAEYNAQVDVNLLDQDKERP